VGDIHTGTRFCIYSQLKWNVRAFARVCLVCWCDVDKAYLQLHVDLGNSDDGVSQVLGDSRLILLVRIRGFCLVDYRNKGIRSDAIDSSHLCPEKTTQRLTPLGLGLSLLLGLQLNQFYELDTVS
jgi:hypothetical protein